jgi:hypothetical protein
LGRAAQAPKRARLGGLLWREGWGDVYWCVMAKINEEPEVEDKGINDISPSFSFLKHEK